MERLRDWRENLPSAQLRAREDPPELLPSPPPIIHVREVLHPVSDRDEWMEAARHYASRPYRSPMELECSPGVVPFHHVGGRHGVQKVFDGHRDHRVLVREKETVREHERWLLEPWKEGEWTDSAAIEAARPTPSPVREPTRVVERIQRPKERIEWCDVGHDPFGSFDDATWCNVDHHAWCLDSGGGWLEDAPSCWPDEAEAGWCDDEAVCWCLGEGGWSWIDDDRHDGILAAAWEEWCDEE